jgi:hypothetical protein
MEILDGRFENILDRNETVIWSGTPNFWLWISSSVPVLGVGMIWGLFDFVFCMFGFSGFEAFSRASGSVTLSSDFDPVSLFRIMNFVFIPFILFHSFPCWGSVLYVIWLFLSYKNVGYAITDKRVVIRTGLFGIDYQIIDHDKLDNIRVNINPIENMIGVGSIIFNTGVMSSGKHPSPVEASFLGIENPYEVFRRLKEVSHDAKTDWSYPNAIRPETNPGYQTKYKQNESNENC